RLLNLRRYPSLDLKTKIFTGEDHYTVVPRLLTEGLRYLWREDAAKLGSSWPLPPGEREEAAVPE
ncbi:MAG: hypothetical protein AAGD40_02630, partial [Pseudomonadota bacterium]